LTKKKLAITGAAALVLLVAGAAAAYFLVLKSDAPPPVSLDAAVAALATPAAGATSAPAATPAGSGSAAATTGLNLTGEWTLVSSSASFVGYRVQEQLVGVGANTAVGRTSSIQASMTFDGASITKLQVTADLRQLRSDNSLRDGQLRSQAIETNRFPNATFVLTSPVSIGAVPAEGQTITRTITGDLTLHGVTKRITMEVQGQLKAGQVVVVGSTEILFADYSISQPRSTSVLSTESKGIMELQLVFGKAAG